MITMEVLVDMLECILVVVLIAALVYVFAPLRKIRPPITQQTMIAQELIDLLSRDPEAKVMIQVEDKEPLPLVTSQISLNNEAHAWVIWETEPCR